MYHLRARIRPAWKLRSNTIFRDVDSTDWEENLETLFKVPYEGVNIVHLVVVTAHPDGLMSVMRVTDSVWISVFETKDAASKRLPTLQGGVVKGSPVDCEVFVEALHPHYKPYTGGVYQAIPDTYGSAPAPTARPLEGWPELGTASAVDANAAAVCAPDVFGNLYAGANDAAMAYMEGGMTITTTSKMMDVVDAEN